jgi:hypothetical protein
MRRTSAKSRREALRLLSAGTAVLASPQMARTNASIQRINDFISFDPAGDLVPEHETQGQTFRVPLLAPISQ